MDGTTALCTTLVNREGVWGCRVTLPSGPHSLTAVQVDPAGKHVLALIATPRYHHWRYDAEATVNSRFIIWAAVGTIAFSQPAAAAQQGKTLAPDSAPPGSQITINAPGCTGPTGFVLSEVLDNNQEIELVGSPGAFTATATINADAAPNEYRVDVNCEDAGGNIADTLVEYLTVTAPAGPSPTPQPAASPHPALVPKGAAATGGGAAAYGSGNAWMGVTGVLIVAGFAAAAARRRRPR